MAERTTTTINAALAGTIDIGGDLPVNRFGFGAMRLTGEGIWGEPVDRDECKRVLRRALELGINFIDTADSYGPEVSERLIAEALYPYPEELVIATKGGLLRPGPGEWVPDGRPQHLRAACEGSLKRLRVEQIDLYQFHRPDPKVPFEESVGALVELKNEGKIRHIGLSNVTTGQVEQAQKLTRIVSVQNRYSVYERSSEPVLEFCSLEEIAFLPGVPSKGVRSPPTGLWRRSPAATARPRPRLRWRGCSSIHPSCCPSLEPRRWRTSSRTSVRSRWIWLRPSSPSSTRSPRSRPIDERGR